MSEKSKKTKISRLAISAVMLSLSTALSMITVAQMPLGGSVTPASMLPICMLSIMYGCRQGLICAFLFSLTQLLLNFSLIAGLRLSPAALVGSVLLDYLAAFTVLGLAGVFRRRGFLGCIGGICLSAALRLVCHVISGVIFFSTWTPEGWNTLFYSLCYNLAFLLPETAFACIGAALLLKAPHAAKLFRPRCPTKRDTLNLTDDLDKPE